MNKCNTCKYFVADNVAANFSRDLTNGGTCEKIASLQGHFSPHREKFSFIATYEQFKEIKEQGELFIVADSTTFGCTFHEPITSQ